MGKLYYFRAPNFDINPDSPTAPKLGSIFSNLDHLTAPLNQDDHLQVPQALSNRSEAKDFRDKAGRSIQTDLGLNATLGQGVAGSAELRYAFARDKEKTYHCEVLETLEFWPNEEFVADSIAASPRVQRLLKNSLFGRKRVYMVTGLKIASGFGGSVSGLREHGPSAGVSVGGAGFSIPAEVGPRVGVTVGSSRTVETGRTLNRVVFAYRVIRIKVRRDGEARYEYKSGGKYDVEEDNDDSEDGGGGLWVLEEMDEADGLAEVPSLVRVEFEN